MAEAKLLGIPVLLQTGSTLSDHPRGALKLMLKKVFFRILCDFAYCVLSVGQRNTEYWRRHLGHDFQLFFIPYAAENAFFQQRCHDAATTREDLRRELNLELGRLVILFASKLLARKRCIDLVDAYLQLVARLRSGNHSGPLPYLLIVGDGEERACIEARLRDSPSEAAKGIRVLGFRDQSELPSYYNLCDVFVLPSIHEPRGDWSPMK